MDDADLNATLDGIRAEIAGLREAFAKHAEEDMEVFREVSAGLTSLREWAALQDEERKERHARQDERDRVMRELAEQTAHAEEERRKAVVFYGRMIAIGVMGGGGIAGLLKTVGMI